MLRFWLKLCLAVDGCQMMIFNQIRHKLFFVDRIVANRLIKRKLKNKNERYNYVAKHKYLA